MSRRIRRFLMYPLAVAVPVLGMLTGVGAASAGASTAAPAAAAHSTAAPAAAIAAAKQHIAQLTVGHHTGFHQAGAGHPVSGLTQEESTNWAGYSDTGSSFSKVSSSWTEPTPSCTSGSEQMAAFWVGIDGYSSDSVEQDGTLIDCYQGQTYQYTWWEMYPSNAIQAVGSSVAAGDKITATVSRSGTSYTLSVTDATHTANSFSTSQSCSSCANSSAEWIAEAPSSGSSVLPLAKFSTWTAGSDSVTEGSTAGTISSFTDEELTMINDSSAVKAQPGSLSSGGNSFTVTWDRAS